MKFPHWPSFHQTLLAVCLLPLVARAFSVAPLFPARIHTVTQHHKSSSLCSTVSSNSDLLPGINSIQELNTCLYDRLENLRTDPYFRFYSVDILASCEYMPQELVECYTESCEIYPADEEEVGEKWSVWSKDSSAS